MATTASLLAQVEAAIEALVNGGASSYSMSNRSVTKLDLTELMQTRDKLRAQLDRETRGGFSLAKFQRRSR